MRSDMLRFLSTLLLLAVFAASAPLARAHDDDDDDGGRRGHHSQHWVTAWGTSQQPNATPVPVTNATVRMIVRVTIPGDAIRIRLDNTFGPAAVTIGRAHVAQRQRLALVAAGSSRALTFGGAPSVTIPAGGSVMSDPVSIRVYSQHDLAVSLYLPGSNVIASQHGGAVTTSYRTPDGSGDQSANETTTPWTLTTTSFLWVKAVDVLTDRSVRSVVAFGDSITDGTCNTLDANDRWHNIVSVRMDTEDKNSVARSMSERFATKRAFVNEGIGGNTVTRATLVPPPDSTPTSACPPIKIGIGWGGAGVILVFGMS